MRNKWLVLLMAGLVIVGLVGSAAARGGNTRTADSGGQRPAHKGRTGKLTLLPWSKLGVTTEQKENIANLRLTFEEKALELRTELARGRLKIQKLLLEEPPDLARVYELVDEITFIQAEIQKKGIEFSLELKSILTEEQREKLSGLGLGRAFGGRMGHGMPMVHGGCWG
jgi:Spy/CpxP family protein refolding chaperone